MKLFSDYSKEDLSYFERCGVSQSINKHLLKGHNIFLDSLDDIECANLLNDAFKHRKELKKIDFFKIKGFNNTLKAPQHLKVLKVKEHAKKWGFLIAEIPKILAFQKERIKDDHKLKKFIENEFKVQFPDKLYEQRYQYISEKKFKKCIKNFDPFNVYFALIANGIMVTDDKDNIENLKLEQKANQGELSFKDYLAEIENLENFVEQLLRIFKEINSYHHYLKKKDLNKIDFEKHDKIFDQLKIQFNIIQEKIAFPIYKRVYEEDVTFYAHLGQDFLDKIYPYFNFKDDLIPEEAQEKIIFLKEKKEILKNNKIDRQKQYNSVKNNDSTLRNYESTKNKIIRRENFLEIFDENPFRSFELKPFKDEIGFDAQLKNRDKELKEKIEKEIDIFKILIIPKIKEKIEKLELIKKDNKNLLLSKYKNSNHNFDLIKLVSLVNSSLNDLNQHEKKFSSRKVEKLEYSNDFKTITSLNNSEKLLFVYKKLKSKEVTPEDYFLFLNDLLKMKFQTNNEIEFLFQIYKLVSEEYFPNKILNQYEFETILIFKKIEKLDHSSRIYSINESLRYIIQEKFSSEEHHLFKEIKAGKLITIISNKDKNIFEVDSYFKRDKNNLFNHSFLKSTQLSSLNTEIQSILTYFFKDFYETIYNNKTNMLLLKQLRKKKDEMDIAAIIKKHVPRLNKFSEKQNSLLKEKLEKILNLLDDKIKYYIEQYSKKTEYSINLIDFGDKQVFLKTFLKSNLFLTSSEKESLSQKISCIEIMKDEIFYKYFPDLIIVIYKYGNDGFKNSHLFDYFSKEDSLKNINKLIKEKILTKPFLNILKKVKNSNHKKFSEDYHNKKQIIENSVHDIKIFKTLYEASREIEAFRHCENILTQEQNETDREQEKNRIKFEDNSTISEIIEIYRQTYRKIENKKLKRRAKNIFNDLENVEDYKEYGNNITEDSFLQTITVISDMCEDNKNLSEESIRKIEGVLYDDNDEVKFKVDSEENIISARHLYQMQNKTMDRDSNYEKYKNIEKDENAKKIIRTYPYFFNNPIRIDEPTNQDIFNKGKDFIHDFSKFVSLYVSKNTKELGTHKTFPTLKTKSKLYFSINEIFISVLSPNRGKEITEKETRRFEREVEKWINEYNLELKYAFICIITGTISEELRKNNYNIIYIDDSTLPLIFDSKYNPYEVFERLIIVGYNLKEVVKLTTDDPVIPGKHLHVERDEYKTIISNDKWYAISGARRIGKTSLLKHVEQYYKKRKDTHVYIKSINTNRIKNTSFSEVFELGFQVLDHLSEITNLTFEKDKIHNASQFKEAFIKQIEFLSNNKESFLLILDEVDVYLQSIDEIHKKEDKENGHELFNCFRDIKINSGFRIIIAGFMRLHNYMENPSIETENEKIKSPWIGGTFELINLQILDKNKSLELINYLHNRLALEFEYPELPELIFDRTTGHPSFIQHFLSKLISLVSERILQTGERLILSNDVDHILKENDELKYPQIDNTTSFSKFVYNKMLPNLNGFDWKILAMMIMLKYKNNQKTDIKREVNSFYDDNFSDNIFEGSITRLHATNIISVTKDNIKFRNKFWAEYLEDNPNLLDEYV